MARFETFAVAYFINLETGEHAEAGDTLAGLPRASLVDLGEGRGEGAGGTRGDWRWRVQGWREGRLCTPRSASVLAPLSLPPSLPSSLPTCPTFPHTVSMATGVTVVKPGTRAGTDRSGT